MLKLSGLKLQRGQKTILQLDQAELRPGEFVAILGPNGAGKSTLLKMIASEWTPNEGAITLFDEALPDWDRQQRARQVGVLPQSSQLSFPFTAKEVVNIGTTPLALDKAEQQQTCEFWMKKADCWQFADRIYTSLSGGERQRVQLARVLVQLSQATQPPLLLLDEPTSAQDLSHQHHILALLKELSVNKQFGIITILHDLNQASRYADNVWLIADGKLIVTGKPADILQAETIQNIWHYQAEELSDHQGNKVFI